MQKGYILVTSLLLVFLLVTLTVLQFSSLTVNQKRVAQYYRETQKYFQGQSDRALQRWQARQP